ncbi:MAG: hypothetical protein Q4C56_01300 [Peptococcaceae bacterium]|nr:hypothetical protein [Peptococcaceae bacterium]
MKNTQGLHRDLFVGEVATALAADGYYGETVGLYGYACGGETRAFAAGEDCARAYLRDLAAGAALSRPVYAEHHLEDGEAAEAAARDALTRAIADAQAMPARRAADLAPVWDYLARHAGQAALVGAIATLPNLAIDAEARAQLRALAVADDDGRAYHGYLARTGAGWQLRAGANLFALLGHWLEDAGTGVSPIAHVPARQGVPIYKQRQALAAQLAARFDADYRALLEAILPHA